MPSNFVDSHTHIYREYYPDNFQQVVEDALAAKVTKMILPGVNSRGLVDIFEAVDLYPDNLFPLVGLHPTDVFDNYQEELDIIHGFVEDPRIVGIGEIGLDFYHDRDYAVQQQDAFYRQLCWAKDYQKPLSLHIRSAYNEALPIMKQFAGCGLKGVLHCFSGGTQEAEWAVDFGFALGIGGVITFKNNKLQDIVKLVGLQHIVLETDAPFLAPVPFRGQQNQSAYIPLIAQKVADLLNTSVEEVMTVTTQNCYRIFDKIAPY